MNNFRYVIEWKNIIWDEGSNDNWRQFETGRINREIFENEGEFNHRLTELDSRIYDDMDVKICRVYTCELQPVRGIL